MQIAITLALLLGILLWGWALTRMPSSGYIDVDRRQLWRAVVGLVAFLVAGVCALIQVWG